jgi:hypothetical protein
LLVPDFFAPAAAAAAAPFSAPLRLGGSVNRAAALWCANAERAASDAGAVCQCRLVTARACGLLTCSVSPSSTWCSTTVPSAWPETSTLPSGRHPSEVTGASGLVLHSLFSRSPPCLFHSSRDNDSCPSVVARASRSIVGHHDDALAGASMFLSWSNVNDCFVCWV